MRPMLLNIRGVKFKRAIRKRLPLMEYAKKLGLSKQSVSNWIAADSIPVQRLIETIELLNLSREEIEVILHPFLERARLAPPENELAHNSPEPKETHIPVVEPEGSGENLS